VQKVFNDAYMLTNYRSISKTANTDHSRLSPRPQVPRPRPRPHNSCVEDYISANGSCAWSNPKW